MQPATRASRRRDQIGPGSLLSRVCVSVLLAGAIWLRVLLTARGEQVKTFKKLSWGGGPIKMLFGAATMTNGNSDAWSKSPRARAPIRTHARTYTHTCKLVHTRTPCLLQVRARERSEGSEQAQRPPAASKGEQAGCAQHAPCAAAQHPRYGAIRVAPCAVAHHPSTDIHCHRYASARSTRALVRGAARDPECARVSADDGTRNIDRLGRIAPERLQSCSTARAQIRGLSPRLCG